MSEENVVEFLTESLDEISKDRKVMNDIDDYLFGTHKFPIGFFQELVINKAKLDELEESQLVVILNAINKITNDEKYAAVKYFTQSTVKKALKYKFKKQDEVLEFPLVYEKTISGSDSDYITKLTYQEIKRHIEQVWQYNTATQRIPVETVKKNGDLKEKPKVFKKSVEEISQLMLDGVYKPDSPIVVNVLQDGNDEIFYDEDNFRLIIEKASEIDIIDGFHRVSAILVALEENPELEGYLYISVRNYDLETARYYLGQHNSFNTFDKTHVRRLKSLKIADKIVEDLDSKSDLRKRIATKTAVQRKLNKITNFAILSDTIKETFNPQTGKDRLEVSYVLIRFFDYLLGSYPEAFNGVKNVEETWKQSWINHHNTFVLYVTIAHELYKRFGKDFPLDEITKIVGSIDFAKESGHQFNDLLTDGGTAQGKVNSNQTKRKIKQFGEKLMEEMYGLVPTK
ncbi:DNA sulfur modification protein DndB [Paenibacillus vulneris]|uniref:DNA sulfur modification protein DndB n=1 Tax=Paenibacillus vulneris TaxID=1133364 RepID=A0ABW3UIF7_9BACL